MYFVEFVTMASNFVVVDRLLAEVFSSDEEEVVGDVYWHDSDIELEGSGSDAETIAQNPDSDSEADNQVPPAKHRGRGIGQGG